MATTTNPALPSTSMTTDVTQLFKQEAADKHKTQAALEKQMQTEEEQQRTHQAEVSAMAAGIQKDITANEKLANLNPQELSKYLNLSALTQPPKQEGFFKASTLKKFIPALLAFFIIGRKAGGDQFGLQDSLTAMTGLLNGWKEGNDAKYKENYQRWKDKTDEIVQRNQTAIQAYKDTLANRNLNLDQRLQLLQVLSMNDPTTHALVKGGDLAKVGDHIDQLNTSYEKFLKLYDGTKRALKPIEPKPEMLKSVWSVVSTDPNISRFVNKDDPTQTPSWVNLLYQKEANFASYLQVQALEQGQQIDDYNAALQAHQEAYAQGWIKTSMTGFQEPALKKQQAQPPQPEE